MPPAELQAIETIVGAAIAPIKKKVDGLCDAVYGKMDDRNDTGLRGDVHTMKTELTEIKNMIRRGLQAVIIFAVTLVMGFGTLLFDSVFDKRVDAKATQRMEAPK